MSDSTALTEWRVSEVALQPLSPNEVIERRALVMRVIKEVMVEGRDYGTIPGTDQKSLWKSGAEKLGTFFGYSSRITPVDTVMDWTGKDHGGEPLFFFRHKCEIRHGSLLVTEMEASCNSWEKKYRWREGKRKCPKCGKETVFKERPRDNDQPGKQMGFYCWNKKGGCGAKFAYNDSTITSQQVGIVKNDDIFDQVNTIQKMSEKRAFVGAVIIACNAGEFFALNLADEDDDEELGNVRPTFPTASHDTTTPADAQIKAQAASVSLRGDQDNPIGAVPPWTDELSTTQDAAASTTASAAPTKPPATPALASPVTSKPVTKHDWPGVTKIAVMKAGHAVSTYEAAGMLNLLDVTPTDPLDFILARCKVYKEHRNAGLEPTESAALAIQETTPTPA